jgi:hypothetical protein
MENEIKPPSKQQLVAYFDIYVLCKLDMCGKETPKPYKLMLKGLLHRSKFR